MIEKRTLGTNGPAVGCLGYGAMVLEGYYGASDDKRAVKTIHHAFEAGMTMIDTADAYGRGHNETLVGQAIRGRRDQAFVATKFGIVFDDKEIGSDFANGWGATLKVNGKAKYVRKSLDASLTRLGISTIDLLYMHWPDPDTPIEETVDAMADGVATGKIRYLGLSNVTPEQVRRAHSVHPIAAVQYEYSLWRREAEISLLPVLRELGIALVPWSPLGSGFLTGTMNDIDENDIRRLDPRYADKNIGQNVDRFAPIMGIAREMGVTPAQLALAWLLHQGRDIIPIPGTRRPERVTENAAAAAITLDPAALQLINTLARPGLAVGAILL